MNDDFIEIYDEALDPERCGALIARFNASGQAVRGKTGGGIDTRLKDSWDIGISEVDGWQDAEALLNQTMLAALLRYARKYAHLALAPLSLRMPDPATGELVLLDADALARLDDTLLRQLLTKVFRPGAINIQRYLADEGGYPYWHCEFYPRAGSADPLHRVLLWTIYLNDGFGAGETEFLYQQRRIVPKTGSLLIAPAGFTHTHRGNRPTGGDKYIATSWILFRRAEELYATKPPQR